MESVARILVTGAGGFIGRGLCRELVMRGYETARQVVAKNRAAVRAMAEELLLVESLDADGIKAIIASAA
jgi:uncharacterized protein YbjT (DUF2867 family)